VKKIEPVLIPYKIVLNVRNNIVWDKKLKWRIP